MIWGLGVPLVEHYNQENPFPGHQSFDFWRWENLEEIEAGSSSQLGSLKAYASCMGYVSSSFQYKI